MAARATKKKAPIEFETAADDSRPGAAVAAGLLISVLKVSHHTDLASFARDYRQDPDALPLALSADQTDLLQRFRNELAHVSILDAGEGATITTTLAVCTACGEHLYLTSDATAPRKCAMTLGCEGVVVKAKPAPRKKTAATGAGAATGSRDHVEGISGTE